MKISKLKEIRSEKNVKQETLAHKAKISLRAYRYYEAGERVPDVHTAQRIANALHSDVKIIFPLPKV